MFSIKKINAFIKHYSHLRRIAGIANGLSMQTGHVFSIESTNDASSALFTNLYTFDLAVR